MRVFLSYSRTDEAFVRRLADDLESRGLDVWLDTEELATADHDRWRRSIVQAIRESVAVVVVLSPDSVVSGPVERELTIAAETGRRIVPIVHRPCELSDGLQFELAGVQRIDFAEQPYGDALAQLLRRVGTPPGLAAAPSTPAPLVAAPPVAHDATPHVATVAASRPAAPATEPSPSTGPHGANRRRQQAVVGAITLLVAGTIGVVAAAMASGGQDRDDEASDTTVSNTTVSDTTVSNTTAIAAEEPATSEPDPGGSTTNGTPATTEPAAVTTTAPVRATQESAIALIDELVAAYNDRDWEAVRRLNPDQADWTSDELTRWYGLMEQMFLETLSARATGALGWEVEGALLTWDETDPRTTNLVCMRWAVDTEAEVLALTPFNGADGVPDRRLDGWAPVSELHTETFRYCA